ncbi:MAG: ATP-binding cassette domain-containing protein [Acidobacteria bacterium]|nr:ATP-binding cassette domain-containing protein [Acidobacteriota bacterium]MBP8273551.1 ATP-binding cassette domain-containing protein [Acidobacteriota bacterium]
MSAASPLFAFTGVVKPYGGPQPLKISQLSFVAGDRVVLAGLDDLAAEMFMHVLTGAALPESGRIEVFGQSTHDIATDTQWLASLDRFGLVSNRAVLLDQSTMAQNLALPMTLSIDPMADDVRAAVERMASDVGLAADRLDALAGTTTPEERMRVHLARAIALTPDVLLLEHPTTSLGESAAAFGESLRALADARGLSWLAISNDVAFQRASGGRVLHLDSATGRVRPAGGSWWRWFST